MSTREHAKVFATSGHDVQWLQSWVLGVASKDSEGFIAPNSAVTRAGRATDARVL